MNDQLTFDDDDATIALRTSWENVQKRLQTELPQAWFERFIRPLKPYTLDGATAVISAPGKFVQEWVRERYVGTIQQQLSDELGYSVTVELRAELQEKQPMNVTVGSVALPQRPDVSSFKLNQKWTFESYVVGQSNRLAVAGAKAVADEPGVKYNPLFIYGPSGLGKTHLLHALAGEILRRNPGFPLAFVTAQTFAEEFVNALQNNKIEQFRRRQREVSVWLVDDIQFIAGKDKTQEEVFHTFNYLHSLGKQIVLTSDRPPRDIFLMDERLRSRLESGLVADVQLPDTETRCAILLSKSAQESFDLHHDVAMYLAENVPGNIRVLEGALTKLVASASVERMPITLGLASLMVEQYYRAGVLAKPSFDQIVNAVSRHYKIPNDDIKGTSRKAPIVHARHVAVYITREITGDSWKHIGGLFGDRDHTSMMHGYQKIGEMMQGDRDLRTVVKMLIRNLYPEA